MSTGGRIVMSPAFTIDPRSSFGLSPACRPLAKPAAYAAPRPAITAATFQTSRYQGRASDGVTDSTFRRTASVCSGVGRGNASFKFIRRLRISRSEEHTSELQSHSDLVCRLLLEKKNSHTDYS